MGVNGSSRGFCLFLYLALAACAPVEGTEGPVIQGGYLEYGAIRSVPPRTPTGRVLNSPVYDGGETFWVRLRFASAYQCETYLRATRTLSVGPSDAPTATIPVPVGFAECPIGEETFEVAFPLRDFRAALTAARGGDSSLNLYADYRVSFEDDGRADRIDDDGNPVELVGTATLRIYLSELAPGTRPRIETVRPSTGLPGWDLEIAPGDVTNYETGRIVGGLGTPIRPHVGVSWAFSRAMAFVHVDGRPRGAVESDAGEGIVYPPVGGATFPGGFRYGNESDLGLVPGRLYDLFIRGAEGLGDLDAPASVAVDGAPLEPRVDPAIPLDAPIRRADTRLSFRVAPIRIESPRRASPAGFVPGMPAVTQVSGVLALDTLVQPVDLSARVRARITERGGGAVVLDVDLGPYASVVSAGTDATLDQAGETYSVRAFTGLLPIPFGSPLVGVDDDDDPSFQRLYTLDLEVVQGDGTLIFGDTRDAAFDLAIPVLPGAACAPTGPVPGDTCVWIDDTDDRDCAVEEVCVAGGSPDVVSLSVVVCGVQVTVPALFDAARGAVCTGPVATGGMPGSGSRGSVGVIAVDDAGNVSAPFGGASCFRSPPRVLSTVRNGLPLGAAVARTSTGRPLTVTIDASAVRPFHTELTVSIWDGTTWQRQVLDAASPDRAWVHRGRIDREVLPDGSLLFCATRRAAPTRAGAGFGTAADDLDPALEGKVDLIHVDLNGVASITEVDDARPFGCGVTAQNLLGEERIVVAYADREGASGTRLTASPTFTTCERTGTGITCADNTVARSLLATFPLFGQDIDAMLDGSGRLHIVGRGVLSNPVTGGFEEYSVFRVRVNPSLDTAGFDRVLSERRDPAPPPLGCQTYSDGYRSPRLMMLDDRIILTYEELGNPTTLPPRTDGNAIRVRARTLTPSGAALGPTTDIGLVSAGGRFGFGRAWSSGTFSPSAPSGSALCSSVDRSVPSAFDLDSDGRIARVVFATRDDVPGDARGPGSGGFDVLRQFRPTTGLHDASVLLMGSSLTFSSRLVDAEVGRLASADSTAALLAPSSVSVFIDSAGEANVTSNRSLSTGFDFVYFEERARQWLEGRDATVVPGTCDARAGVVLSEPALNLSLVTPFSRDRLPWATVRIPTMLTAAYPNYASNLACALDTAMEEAVPPLRMPGVEDASFYRDVRDAFGASLMSMASMIESPNRPAMVVGRSLGADPALVAVPTTLRRLRVEVNGSARDVTRTRPSNALPDVVSELNALLGGTASRPVIALTQETAADSRTLSDSRVAVLGWAAPDSTPRPTVRVLSSPLRTFFGLDGDLATGLGRVLDASEGDRHGRLRNCSDACTGSTCSLPRDCIDMNADSAPDGLADNLLYHATRGLHLVDGMPPLRTGQSGICVPLEQRTDPEACFPSTTTTHRGGTPADYLSFARFLPITGTCGTDEETTVDFASARVVCAGCGGPSATGVPEGRPRLCRSDADCNPARACIGGDCASLTAAGVSLCTQLSGNYMGVPAGTGFCAEPVLCASASATCVSRPYDDLSQPPYAQSILVETASGVGVPPPLNVGAGDFGVRANRVECAMTGCSLCTGTEVNGFCNLDTECAPGHVCLRSTAADLALETPACLLRPVLHDGRLLDLPAYAASSPDPTVPNLDLNTETPTPTVGIVTGAVNTLQSTLDTTLRALAIPPRIISDPLDITPAGADALVLDTIDVRLAGAVMEVRPLPANVVVAGYRPGTDAIRATVFIDRVRVAGRTQFELTDALEAEGRFAARIVNVRAFTMWLLPYVAPAGGADALLFRAVDPVFLERSAARGDGVDVPISNDNVSLDVADGLEALLGLFDFASIFLPIVTNGLNSLIVEYIVGSPAPGWFSGALTGLPVDPVGNLYTSLATTPFVAPLFFGVSPVMDRTRTYPGGGVGPFGLENGFARTGSGLGLRFRGADLGDDIAELLRAQRNPVTSDASACCIGGEPDPAVCLAGGPCTPVVCR